MNVTERRVSVFGSGDNHKPIRTATVRDIVEFIRSDRLKADIERLRGHLAAGQPDLYNAGKLRLMGVSWSGVFSYLNKKSLTTHSGLVVIDFDHLGASLPTVRAKLEADPAAVVVFTSPSGDGLKAIYAVGDMADHSRAWRAAADRAKRLTGIESDEKNKDVSRLCFLSHDPACHFNPDPAPVEVPTEPEPVKIEAPKPTTSAIRAEKYGRAALEKAVAAVVRAVDGSRNQTLNDEAYTLGQLIGGGVLDEIETRETLRRAAIGAGLSEEETRKTIESAIEAGKAKPRTVPEPRIEPTVPNGQAERDADPHRNQPKPTAAMLYGLAGDVGRTAAKDTEVNPYAACAGFLSFISAAMGRNAFLSVGNTRHHPRLFMLHVGRTGRGRKGDALALVKRIRNFLAGDNAGATSTVDVGAVPFPGQLHTGGLSTREGLALLLHDEMKQGKEEIPAIDDKRLWIIESEFENVLQQGKRDGNTLSSALRDAWDGESIRPAIKSARVWASDPHVAFSGAITPGELRTLLDTKAMTNGFANRFMIFWGERTGLVSRPKATPKAVMEALAMRTKEVIEFAKGDYPRTKDGFEFAFTAEASKRYDELYRGELNRYGYGALVDAILERRAPMLVRLAMILALTDRTRFIEVHHVDAALSWIQYFRDSVRFIFSDEGEFEAEEKRDVAEKIIEFLRSRGEATRTQFTSECFAGHVAGDRIDAALSDLLAETPPRIEIRKGPKSANNKRAKIYTLCEVRELGEAEGLKRFPGSSPACEVRELDQPTRPLPFSSSPSSQPRELPETPISPSSAPSSPTSQGIQENEPHDDGWCQI